MSRNPERFPKRFIWAYTGGMELPPGNWVTIHEATKLVRSVSLRRLQALAASGRVRSVQVLGRWLLDRDALIAWRDTRDRKGGRPKKEGGS